MPPDDETPRTPEPARSPFTRRRLLAAASAGVLAAGAATFRFRRGIRQFVSAHTRARSFSETPALLPHDPIKDKTRVAVAQGAPPASNVDSVLDKLGGIGAFVGDHDVVVVKVSAQWWNQGMTNVAAAKRVLEQIFDRTSFKGDVVVFENTHFRLADGSGLSRAWTHPSDRNVDVAGWSRLGDLVPHFEKRGAPISFVGLVDAGKSSLAGDSWQDPSHEHGTYGGDGRGPIADGDGRDGYFWDFNRTFRLKRSLVDDAQTPLSWPRFTCPRTGLVIDLAKGVFVREGGALKPTERKLTFVNLTTGNEHDATGFTGACKSPMGIVDMSCGRLGDHPLVADYQSVHYFGMPEASWRMAGPLATFCREVIKPSLYLTIMEWSAIVPKGVSVGAHANAQDDGIEPRLDADCAVHAKTIVAGTDPVAIDAWAVRNVVMPASPARPELTDLDSETSVITKFLRYYRQVAAAGTLDPALVEVI